MSRQQLFKRKVNTPRSDIPASMLCGSVFKQSSCSGDSEQNKKTLNNNPEEFLTSRVFVLRTQEGQNYPVNSGVSVIYVLHCVANLFKVCYY